MWLCTQFGFFSVVRDTQAAKTEGVVYLVRSRNDADLRNLVSATNVRPIDARGSFRGAPAFPKVPVGGFRKYEKQGFIYTPTADYPVRIRIDQDGLDVVMRVLAESVDYGNFKSRVHETPGQDRNASAYHRVWSIMGSTEPPGLRGPGIKNAPYGPPETFAFDRAFSFAGFDNVPTDGEVDEALQRWTPASRMARDLDGAFDDGEDCDPMKDYFAGGYTDGEDPFSDDF